MTKRAWNPDERFSVTVMPHTFHSRESRGLVYGYGEDADGYEVVWTMTKSEADKLDYADIVVAGSRIIAYSGEAGPWARARVPGKGRA